MESFYKVTIKLFKGDNYTLEEINLWPKTLRKLKAIPRLWKILYDAYDAVSVVSYKPSIVTGTNTKRLEELNYKENMIEEYLDNVLH